jgi:hypothetical protein
MPAMALTTSPLVRLFSSLNHAYRAHTPPSLSGIPIEPTDPARPWPCVTQSFLWFAQPFWYSVSNFSVSDSHFLHCCYNAHPFLLQCSVILATMLSHFRELYHSSLLQCSPILDTVLNHFSWSNSAHPFLLQCSVILAIMHNHFSKLNHSSCYNIQPFPLSNSAQPFPLLQCSCILIATVLGYFSQL